VWERRASEIHGEWEVAGSDEFEEVMLAVKLLESYKPPIPLKQELIEKASALMPFRRVRKRYRLWSEALIC